MPKSEWGVKRLCGACGVRYYDLAREPAVCPKCGETYVSVQAAEKAKAAKIAEATAADTDEDLVDDGDEISLDEVEAADDGTDLADDSDDDEENVVDDALLDTDGDDEDLGDFKPTGSGDEET
ncbi:MAG: TIGR02300 family protein [Pikeienuella sp.]